MDKDPIEEIKKELVRIFEPLFFKVVYFLGLFSKQIRLEAYDDKKYLWGIIQFIKDDPASHKTFSTLREKDIRNLFK